MGVANHVSRYVGAWRLEYPVAAVSDQLHTGMGSSVLAASVLRKKCAYCNWPLKNLPGDALSQPLIRACRAILTEIVPGAATQRDETPFSVRRYDERGTWPTASSAPRPSFAHTHRY